MTIAGDAAVAAAGRGQELYARARRIIPGGTQLLSKRPEMFLPGEWPSYFSRAEGARVWDLDGTAYLDMSYSGIGACTLGYADPDVNRAVHAAVDAGTMTTLNCPEEFELAELLLELHPWAEMVRYTRGGGDAMSVAIRIARAATGRDTIAFCGYHGWNDWYLAANLSATSSLDGHLLPGLAPAGVPRGLLGTILPFQYNRLDEFREVVRQHGPSLAAIVLEPIRNFQPAPGFLEEIRRVASEIGAVLIFDEITSGWRLNDGGAHLGFGVTPDVAVFAKGMSNGYPMGAVIGVHGVMEAAQGSFVSSTYWTERIGPVAALATIRKFRERNAADHLVAVGSRVQAGWRAAAAAHGLAIHVGGIAPLGHFAFEAPPAQAMRTLFTQLMLDRGFLATGAFYAMYAHSDAHVDSYLAAVDKSFAAIARAVRDGTVEAQLRGPVAHTGFRRLT
jgi:glutamate-1-semialdehyde 2,1-aminomutase